MNLAGYRRKLSLMPASAIPFPVPASIERSLAQVLSHWEGLKRAENNMPFWDDLKPSALSDQSGHLLLVDVFAEPERFRFNLVAKPIAERYGESLVGKFADDVALQEPFAYFRAQCSVTVEARSPSYYRSSLEGSRDQSGYARILLPMWGEGQIRMLLGAIDWR